MFSLKEWNFEEYKAAVNEIQDPVERMDEINYSIKSGWDEIRDYDGVTVIIGKTIEEFEEEVRKYRILNEWGTKEIENIKFLHAEAIARKKTQAWQGHFRLPYPLAWNMKSYRFFSKHFDRVEEKKKWLEWLISNINEGDGYGWQFDGWIYNAVLNEPLYKSFAEDQIEIENLSYIVSSIECDFVQFLLKTNHVYEFKQGNKQNSGLRKNPIRQKEFNQIEELIFKTVNSRIKDKKSLNWMSVLRDLKNNVATGQSIHFKDSTSRDELMRPCISLFIDGLDEPIHRMQISTFKKKLSQFRKITVTRVTGE